MNGSTEARNGKSSFAPARPEKRLNIALPYLLHHGLPQFFFHVTIAYAILRHSGLEIGKTD